MVARAHSRIKELPRGNIHSAVKNMESTDFDVEQTVYL